MLWCLHNPLAFLFLLFSHKGVGSIDVKQYLSRNLWRRNRSFVLKRLTDCRTVCVLGQCPSLFTSRSHWFGREFCETLQRLPNAAQSSDSSQSLCTVHGSSVDESCIDHTWVLDSGPHVELFRFRLVPEVIHIRVQSLLTVCSWSKFQSSWC